MKKNFIALLLLFALMLTPLFDSGTFTSQPVLAAAAVRPTLILQCDEMTIGGAYAKDWRDFASNGRILTLPGDNTNNSGWVEAKLDSLPDGKYDIVLYYNNENDGDGIFRLDINGVKVKEFKTNSRAPSAKSPNADELSYTNTHDDGYPESSMTGITLRKGDTLRLTYTQNFDGERGRIDKLEFYPAGTLPSGPLTPIKPPAPYPPQRGAPGSYDRTNFFNRIDISGTPYGRQVYLLHQPANPRPGKKYPVIVYLHGTGPTWEDARIPDSLIINGSLLNELMEKINRDPDYYESYVLVPAGYLGNNEMVKSIIQRLIDFEAGDADRVYVTGVSAGGFATTYLMYHYPEMIAAAAPVCGVSVYEGNVWTGPWDWKTADRVKDIPLRLYHSKDDNVVPYNGGQGSRPYYEAVKAAGGTKVEYFELDGWGHSADAYAYTFTGLLEWMLLQNKRNYTVRQPEPETRDITIAEPAKGKTPQMIVSEKKGTLGTISWRTVAGQQLTGNFAGETEYRITVTLSAAAGYEWGQYPPEMTVNGQQVQRASFTGTGANRKLSFEYTMPATSWQGQSLALTLQADAMKLGGGYIVDSSKSYASNGKVVTLPDDTLGRSGWVEDTLSSLPDGYYEVVFYYNNENDGNGVWSLEIGGNKVKEFKTDRTRSTSPNADVTNFTGTSMEPGQKIDNIFIKKGDSLKLTYTFTEAHGGAERGRLDRIEFWKWEDPPKTDALTAQDAADALFKLGLFRGTSNGYELNRPATRQEAIVMLIRLLGKEAEAVAYKGNHPFTDVDAWASPYIAYAYNNKLTSGVSADKFGNPGDATAAMYVTFVLRALGYSSSTDFEWDNPFGFAARIGLPTAVYTPASNFMRGDAVIVSHAALSQRLKGKTGTLLDTLIASGAVPAK